jgi:LPS-assembly protein
MKKLCARLCCLVLLSAGPWLRAEEPPLTLVIEPQGQGEFDFNPSTGVATAANGVIVRYGTAYLSATKATLNQTTGEVQAEGNVHIEHDGQVWSGDQVTYNFKTRQLSTGQFRTGQRPFYIQGPGLDVNLTNRLYTTTNAVVTTDDYAEPTYTIHAKRIVVVPGRYIDAQNATFWLGKVPIFYLPSLHHSLEHHPNYWVLTPGYRSLFGPYLLTSYHQVWNEEFETALNLDERFKRGPGAGPDILWHSPAAGEGMLRYYYTYDDKPGRYPNTTTPIDNDRQRVWFSYQATLRTNLTVKAMLRYQSDPYVIRDFYESEYRENVQPNTFLEASQDWPNWNLNLEVQPRVNNFQETVERLPDLKLTGLRQAIGESPFYYETESSLGYFAHLFPDSQPGVTNPLPYEAFRADTYHKVVVPLTFFGWLNLTPRVGERLTYYSSATGAGATTDEAARAVFNTGAELNWKASRLWRDTHSDLLELNGLRHIIEPSINYAYIPNPTKSPNQLPQFDSDLPSYWLLPIEYPDNDNIDSIDSQNVFRFGLRNQLQTKRDEGLDNLLNWTMFTDWYLKPHTNQNTFSLFYNVVELKPRSWCTLTSLTRYDINNTLLREQTEAITLHPSSAWSVTLGQRYRQGGEFGGSDLGNNLLLSSLAYRFNENWSARTTFMFEARNGQLQELTCTLYRDMRSWTGALTFRYQLNSAGAPDYTVAFTFSLKAFPRYGLGKDVDRPSVLLGS